MSPVFSIIIPHYNCPTFLLRCLESIPGRDDIETIIVDDHSSPDKVNFTDFPGGDRENTKLILCDGKKGKGPGYARNEGLLHASGKWVIFCDADDFFLNNLSALMDEHKDDLEDVLYFKASKKMSESAEIEPYEYLCEPVARALQGSDDELLYATPCPVAKFIKLDYLKKHNIRFQEVIGGDDILFSIELSKNTNSRKYIDDSFYCVVMAPSSLTRGTNWRNYYNFSIASCSAYQALAPIGKESYAASWIMSWGIKLAKSNLFRALFLLPMQARNVGLKKALVIIKKGLEER